MILSLLLLCVTLEGFQTFCQVHSSLCLLILLVSFHATCSSFVRCSVLTTHPPPKHNNHIHTLTHTTVAFAFPLFTPSFMVHGLRIPKFAVGGGIADEFASSCWAWTENFSCLLRDNSPFRGRKWFFFIHSISLTIWFFCCRRENQLSIRREKEMGRKHMRCFEVLDVQTYDTLFGADCCLVPPVLSVPACTSSPHFPY